MSSNVFEGRMDEKKKRLVLEFLKEHPSPVAVIGYGSGVIEQQGSKKEDKKQIDLIIIVDDLKDWILENMSMNPDEFTKGTMRYFKNASLEALEKGAPIVYFSSIEYNGELIKMGLISKERFLSSCYDKTSSYVPFRIEKAIELIKCEDDKIKDAILYDHKTTLITALLMLDKDHQRIDDLMEKICSLSYMGDFRMKIHCEDPNKIKNIVSKQFEYFIIDYNLVNDGYFKCNPDWTLEINYEKIKRDLSKLPEDIYERINVFEDDLEGNYHFVDNNLEEYYKEAAEKENLKQAVKGIRTVGLKKALKYALHKVKKGRKK